MRSYSIMATMELANKMPEGFPAMMKTKIEEKNNANENGSPINCTAFTVHSRFPSF